MDLSSFEKDNRVNSKVRSVVPDICKKEPCWLGIDEAGRGPVLGPMVYGICFSPISMKDKLVEMGFADSKTLTEEQREKLFAKINEATDSMGWIIDVLSPNFISSSMLKRSKYNLNALSHDSAIGLVRCALEGGANITEVYVDTVGDPGKYQAKLKDLFPAIDITVAKKADATYPIVSAASICAKVARDHAVRQWQFLEKIAVDETYNYGSGYPGDEKTKKFLTDFLDPVFGFPTFVRFSWSTADKLLDDKAVPMFWEDDEDDENDKTQPPKGVPAITSYFGGSRSAKATAPAKPHHYFTDRCLKPLANFQ